MASFVRFSVWYLWASRAVAAAVLLAGAVSCGESDNADAGDVLEGGAGGADTAGGQTGDSEGGGNDQQTPSTYRFQSRFSDADSVAYTGQAHRQVLIREFKQYISTLTDRIDKGEFIPVPGEVRDALLFYYDFDGASGSEVELTLNTTPALLQKKHGDIGAGANLSGKIAGMDVKGQHKDWSKDLVGFTAASPDSLMRAWIDELDKLATDRAAGIIAQGANGSPLPKVYITADGRDLMQLTEKFMMVAIAFSQAIDDYLDDDMDGMGVLADNTAADGNNAYTPLEHQWDEAFGYFGAARNFGDFTDEEIGGDGGRDGFSKGYNDANGDGFIDVKSEWNYSSAGYAAKRDRGSAPGAATDFTEQIWQGFLRGRALITQTNGALSGAQFAELLAYRDQVADGWESAVAASAVHYLNRVLRQMKAAADGSDYDFESHVKFWSEMKPLSTVSQFNRLSPMSATQFAEVQALLGSAPVFGVGAEADAYAEDLRKARGILAQVYGFATANVGDEHGQGGW